MLYVLIFKPENFPFEAQQPTTSTTLSASQLQVALVRYGKNATSLASTFLPFLVCMKNGPLTACQSITRTASS